jgi:hypothetical protein
VFDRLLIALDGSPDRSLRAPAHRSQDPPHLADVERDAALFLDQLANALERPKTGRIPEGLCPLLELAPDLLDVALRKLRSTTRSTGLAQAAKTLFLQGGRPTAHRLAMNTYFSCDSGLIPSRPQQPRGLSSPILERFEVSLHSRRIAHAETLHQRCQIVTIFSKPQ